jgi:SAM-dependent methyltransferase
MNYFLENNIIKNTTFFYKGCRDDENINIYLCDDTKSLVLDTMKEQKYEDKGFLYWNANNIEESRVVTYDDDIRRYNSLNNCNYKNILDFGCGNGGLLKLITQNKNNINVIGIELNKQIAEYLNKESILVYETLEQIPKQIKLDIIMLNHVLEHLKDPIQILNQIKKYMNKNTLLIIEVPHANDYLIKDMGCEAFKKFTFWSEHYILYTEKSLFNLLNKIGFSSTIFKYYQRYNIFNHLYWLSHGKPGGQKIINSNEIELINSYDSFLVKNKKTDTLIAHCYL